MQWSILIFFCFKYCTTLTVPLVATPSSSPVTNKAKEILTEKIDDLHKIAKALMTYETLTGEEIENIITKNIYPADKQDLKVDDDKSSALGAMGLKPKIVH